MVYYATLNASLKVKYFYINLHLVKNK